jgi:hypothetical protein
MVGQNVEQFLRVAAGDDRHLGQRPDCRAVLPVSAAVVSALGSVGG